MFERGDQGMKIQNDNVIEAPQQEQNQLSIPVMIDGRATTEIIIAPTDRNETVIAKAMLAPDILKRLSGQKLNRTVFVPQTMVNFITE